MTAADPVHSKIVLCDELLALRAAAREQGKVVVQCHGCFDIVHPGHIRHLQHAAKQGDILLVSITADPLVNKGDGRPLFSQDLRAENLAALDCVDWVYINPDPTAETLLDQVRPDVYIKGQEYESNNDPRFRAERDAVERHGGRIIFSSGDIVFSSTALIAAMERRENPFQARLRQLVETQGMGPERLDKLIDLFQGRRVAVFGEAIIDTYVQCDRPDVAGEAPVMSLRPLEHTSYDGGAAIIARHLAALGARPTLVTALPASAPASALRRRLQNEGVDVRWIETDGPMLEKQRFLVGSQKVMKLDLVRPVVVDASGRNELLTIASELARECEGAIAADFGNGLLSRGTLASLLAVLRPSVRVLAGDVSGRRSGLLSMQRMDLVCPTESELRDAVHDYADSLNAVVWKLMQQTRARNVLVTMGADGLIAFERLAQPQQAATDAWQTRVRGEHVPAMTLHAVDQLGCGDALLAAATLALIAGGTTVEAGFLGSIAAAHQAGRLGNIVVGSQDLRAGLRRLDTAKLAVTTGHGTGGISGQRMVV
ncbi:MAG: PfkB family carbohydrate kinase [Phycisphaerales bacterium]